MSVRDAREGDADAIAEVAAESWRATYRDIYDEAFVEAFLARNYAREALVRAIAEPSHTFLVAVEGARIEAFAHLGNRGFGVELFRMYARPSAQRRGHGSRLLDEAEARLRARGTASYFCMVQERNAIGRSFYERRGFVRAPSHDDGDHLRYVRPLAIG